MAAAAAGVATAAIRGSSISEAKFDGNGTDTTACSTHDAIATVAGIRPHAAENVPTAADAATTGDPTNSSIAANTSTARISATERLAVITVTNAEEAFTTRTNGAAGDAISNTTAVTAPVSIAAAAADEI